MSLVELEKIRQRGETLAADGDIAGAVELYRQAGDNGEPKANLHLAGYYADIEEYDKVCYYANRVLLFYDCLKEQNPVVAEQYVDYLSTAYNMIALSCYQSQRWGEALSAIDKAIGLEDYECCYMAGRMAYKGYLSEDGKPDMALALHYWKMGKEMIDDENCFFAWEHHHYDNITHDFYIGESDENHLPHGTGEKNYVKGEYYNLLGYNVAMKRYSGDWVHGVQSGYAEMRFFVEGYDGMLYDGAVECGQPHGDGYIGIWVDDYSEDYYEGNFCHGKRNGHGCMRKDEIYFEGEWVDDRLTGEVKCTLEDQSSFVARFVDGNLDLSSCLSEQALAITDFIVTEQMSGATVKIDGRAKECLVAGVKLTILGVEGGVIKYRLEAENCEPIFGTITPAQSVEHQIDNDITTIITCKTKTL